MFKIAEQVVQEQIAEMQATWQDPTTAWDTNDAWGDDTGSLNANTTTTSVQIETATSNVSDSAQATGDANIIKCIAFYPYTVHFCDLNLLRAYSHQSLQAGAKRRRAFYDGK